MSLEEQVILLQKEIKEIWDAFIQERACNSELRKYISELEQYNHKLEELLRQSKISKNSSNSSKPPSTDIASPKRNQSLREKTGKKPGGQPGHTGTTLQMSESPDEIIELNPNYCNKCGCNLENEEPHLEAKRQVFDIPPINVIVKEYRRNSKKCPSCGNHQEGEFPKSVNNHVQFSDRVESLVAYFSVYQLLPFKRLKECLKHLFNLDMSEGTIDNILNRMRDKAKPIYDQIWESIKQSNHAGSDESSVKVNGDKWWIWVWQTIFSTYITAHKSRGMEAIKSVFPEGLENVILNSDRWASQLKTKAAGHQMCIAHLLRDLNYIEAVDKIDWATRLKALFKKGLELKKQQSEYSRTNPLVMQMEDELDILLQEKIPKDLYHKTYVLQNNLKKKRDYIFTFLYYKDTPADNNGSERAIRVVKVKQKISDQFKSGLERFCVLRSVIDTGIKRGIDVLFVLSTIADYDPSGAE
jgi:transposase